MPISKKGFRYLLVAIDYFTNWVEATVLKTLTADELVSAFFKIIISRHGCPEQLMSDSGTQMVSSALKALCRSFNITKRESSPFHVQANGKVEKFIGFLKKSLALITPERAPCTWDEMIDHCLFVYRISINRTLKDSPFFFLYARDATLPQDLAFGIKTNSRSMQDGEKNYQYQIVQKLKKEYTRLIESKAREQERYKQYYDRTHKQVDFALGEEVMVLFDVPTKGPLMPRWEGPFTIIHK
jgi:transposase InsO family protein